MAILKHIPSHNAIFSDVIDYLTKEHDEETGEPILDEHGQMIDRERFLISGINCAPGTFAEMCLKDCIRFNTNRSKTDVKTHQYILSFAPKDKEKGLTLEAAWREGMRFAKKNFPGHRVIVCAHPDGANGSGNIHVHIIVSALRFEDREPQAEFMRLQSDGSVKESEYKAGCKHQDTARLRRHLNEQLQEFCRENGYTVSEPKPPKKVTNKEYRAKKEGQKQLDRDNEARRQKGQKPVQTEFKSKKDELREIVSHAASISKDWDEFADHLRHSYVRQVEQRPQQPRIPYQQRQAMWEQYKEFNEAFWTQHRRLSEVYKSDINKDFKNLKERKDLEWKAKNRKNSFRERLDAVDKLATTTPGDRDYLKHNISINKEKQASLRLFKEVYQTYSKAAKIALTNNMQIEAERCLQIMAELRRRQEGYWMDDPARVDSVMGYSRGFLQGQRVSYLHTEENDLGYAKAMLQEIEQKKRALEEGLEQPEIKEEAFPFDVKVTRGAISFKHPDLERWTRGKSLGEDYEMEALARVMEQNRLQELDQHYERALEETPAQDRQDASLEQSR